MSQTPPTSNLPPGPAAYTRAPKGKACTSCRTRKMKCDCARPVCRQCVRFGREKDCEYADKEQKSYTEILEENVAALEARIRELDGAGPPTAGPSMIGTQFDVWADIPNSFGLPDVGIARGVPEYSSVSQSMFEPTFVEAQALIETFLPNGLEVGFFLSSPRFLGWAAQRIPRLPSFSSSRVSNDGATREGDALLSAVYLWGMVWTFGDDLKAKQGFYLATALRHLSEITASRSMESDRIASTKPNVLHLIQTHVLLANYLYHNGQFVDARRHTADAASLVLSHRLHKIRSPRPADPSRTRFVRAAEAEFLMGPPADLVEEGERICAFWQVYVLDITWAVMLGCPCFLVEDGSPDTQIDTPWPLAADRYARATLPPGYGAAGRTIQKIFSTPDADTMSHDGLSTLGLRARAAALLYQARWCASSCSSDLARRGQHSSRFMVTDTLLDKLVLLLSRMQSSGEAERSPEALRCLAVTRCIAHFAMVQLHYPFIDDELQSATRCMNASKVIVPAIKSAPRASLVSADPLLPVLLTVPARIITAELVRIASSATTRYRRPLVTTSSPQILTAHIDEVKEVFDYVNPGSKLTTFQVEAVRNFTSALAGMEFARG